MSEIKEEVIRMINNMPDNIGYDDIMAEIYFRQKVDKSIEQISKGQIVEHEEAKSRILKWIK